MLTSLRAAKEAKIVAKRPTISCIKHLLHEQHPRKGPSYRSPKYLPSAGAACHPKSSESIALHNILASRSGLASFDAERSSRNILLITRHAGWFRPSASPFEVITMMENKFHVPRRAPTPFLSHEKRMLHEDTELESRYGAFSKGERHASPFSAIRTRLARVWKGSVVQGTLCPSNNVFLLGNLTMLLSRLVAAKVTTQSNLQTAVWIFMRLTAVARLLLVKDLPEEFGEDRRHRYQYGNVFANDNTILVNAKSFPHWFQPREVGFGALTRGTDATPRSSKSVGKVRYTSHPFSIILIFCLLVNITWKRDIKPTSQGGWRSRPVSSSKRSGELRDMIYEEVLASATVTIQAEEKLERRGSVVHRRGFSVTGPPALLATCKQIRAEASKIHYSRNAFAITIAAENMSMPIKWLNSIRPRHRRMLQHISINFQMSSNSLVPAGPSWLATYSPRWLLDKRRKDTLHTNVSFGFLGLEMGQKEPSHTAEINHDWIHFFFDQLLHFQPRFLKSGKNGRRTDLEACIGEQADLKTLWIHRSHEIPGTFISGGKRFNFRQSGHIYANT
ncbi:uncharacterized protein MYCFIDRAFT_175517 [Pseudocercospora fijiensis CIRAD86]|uniref:Uncharacterized protein n=1 Tax=Pseudocercospora fijiensis (strain CIRAD86) TaxID=383855 RepID=M3AWU8_PSEFD|nr:uncharacterized protein MYCFIDRAFT_175517 [Pseudocercospora fijiensis CIRAD86]EME81942.1 hypothetical protein MYCFIDRAFT_175517 [Pseudocercospora fijiensis CIRAD86]